MTLQRACIAIFARPCNQLIVGHHDVSAEIHSDNGLKCCGANNEPRALKACSAIQRLVSLVVLPDVTSGTASAEMDSRPLNPLCEDPDRRIGRPDPFAGSSLLAIPNLNYTNRLRHCLSLSRSDFGNVGTERGTEFIWQLYKVNLRASRPVELKMQAKCIAISDPDCTLFR